MAKHSQTRFNDVQCIIYQAPYCNIESFTIISYTIKVHYNRLPYIGPTKWDASQQFDKLGDVVCEEGTHALHLLQS